MGAISKHHGKEWIKCEIFNHAYVMYIYSYAVRTALLVCSSVVPSRAGLVTLFPSLPISTIPGLHESIYSGTCIATAVSSNLICGHISGDTGVTFFINLPAVKGHFFMVEEVVSYNRYYCNGNIFKVLLELLFQVPKRLI